MEIVKLFINGQNKENRICFQYNLMKVMWKQIHIKILLLLTHQIKIVVVI